MAIFETTTATQFRTGASDEEQRVIQEIESRVTETVEYTEHANMGSRSIAESWRRGGHFYVGNHWRLPSSNSGTEQGYQVFLLDSEAEGVNSLNRRSVNLTQNAVVSNVAHKTRDPINPRFEGVETSEDPEVFLTRKGGKLIDKIVFGPMRVARQNLMGQTRLADAFEDEQTALAAAAQYQQEIKAHQARLQKDGFGPLLTLASEQYTGNPAPSQPLDDNQAEALRNMVDAGLFPADQMREIDDDTTARAIQRVFDSLWRESDSEQKVADNVFMTEVFGSCPMRLQWYNSGPRKHTFSIQNDHLTASYPDVSVSSVQDMDYYGVDYLIDLDRAKRKWPDLAEELEGATVQDRELEAMGDTIQSPEEFSRPMVPVRVMWRRYQEVPMSEADALSSGKVIREPQYVPLTPEQEQAAAQGVEVSLEQMVDEETGQTMWAYFLVDTIDENGEPVEVEPTDEVGGDSRWPTHEGVEQVVILQNINRIVQRVRSPFDDIPVAWNLNKPSPDGSPYGIGVPETVEGVQKMVNRLVTMIEAHVTATPFPTRVLPATIVDSLRRSGMGLHMRPGVIQPLPDQDFRQLMSLGGFDRTISNVPAVPKAYVDLLSYYIDMHDRLSGNVEVRQGMAPFAGASGKTVESLQEQAVAPLSYSSKYTEWAVERIARIGLTAMIRFLPESEWQKRLSEYTLPMLRRIIERAERRSWNVQVSITTGRGANERRDSDRALALYQSGLLSRETTMSRLNVENADQELLKMQKEALAQAQSQAPVQAAAIDQQDAAG